MKCLIIGLVNAAVMLSSAIAARAQDESAFHELETKYIFGDFTIGSSTGIEGERAFEPETEADFGKRFGRYAAGTTELELEYTPTQYMQIELGPTVSYYNIANVPGLANQNFGGVNGVEGTFRFLLLEPGTGRFAATLSIEPEFHTLDETSGARVSNFGLENRLEADTELIKNRLYYALNLFLEPETTSVPFGGSFNETTFGVSSALALQIIPKVVVGADVWYFRHYEGIAFNSFTGDALYVGPTFFWQIAPKVLVSASWQANVAGHEIGLPGLDLDDFSRHRAKLLIEFEF
jgi:hypothetical protein